MKVLVNTLTAIDGTCIKQGDPSVLRFKLGDFNDDELMLDPVATVYLSHANEVYRFEGTVHKDVVTFNIDKVLPAGIYTLEIECNHYIFPSDKNTRIEIVESQLGKAMSAVKSDHLYDEIIKYGVENKLFRGLLEEERAFMSESLSMSQSMSASISTSFSQSTSTSTSMSVSESLSTSESLSLSVSTSLSASESISESASVSESESVSYSMSVSESVSASISTSLSVSTSTSESLSLSTRTSISESLSVSESESLSVSESASLSESTSESLSISASISESLSTSESQSLSTSASTSVSESESASISTSLSISESASLSESTALSTSLSVSQSQSESLSVSVSMSQSVSESLSVSASLSQSESESISMSVSTSQSVSTSESLAHTPSDYMVDATDNGDGTFTVTVVPKRIFRDPNGLLGMAVNNNAFDFEGKNIKKVEFDGAVLTQPRRVENTIYWAGANNESTDEVKSFISHLVTTRKITGAAEEYRSEPIKFTFRNQ
ncbi:hypothetical protein IHC73_000454 [Staphylococcus pseudintermedius]|uniref:hypothetical protein n=1 Tax=Staphylococcus pseudintermedius TaxID=283734 RepID=UPI00111FDE33|nr:hypothetical protein [Staphylococcus pseudintermedius]EGQ1753787.1 hypothetical protein [Staphylococcus pseudintermedius]EGQ2703127.1 hypothetical protein [Staphylococcus pseudintermedius]EGQ2814013.1 hypothetical protein [Staphylococcus pseudintermedius]EGQ2962525.1 hypothetical protein [Staphylococcus pseudintermedius]EGQ3220041.1 hypothetical protein [Staphylococcus pseudintermedius]